jgi:hypothetical protein
MLAAPLRQRILEALAEPGSASTMARTLGLARQKVADHVRQLEKHGAEKAGKRLPTLSADVEIRLRSPREREAFELLEAIARLAAKYHDEMHPDGRTYRVVVGAHPIRRTRRKP